MTDHLSQLGGRTPAIVRLPDRLPFGEPAQRRKERDAAQEHAVRQLHHLARDIDYGYPPAHVRPLLRSATDAVRSYNDACVQLRRAEGYAAKMLARCPTCHGIGRVRGNGSPTDPCPDC